MFDWMRTVAAAVCVVGLSIHLGFLGSGVTAAALMVTDLSKMRERQMEDYRLLEQELIRPRYAPLSAWPGEQSKVELGPLAMDQTTH